MSDLSNLQVAEVRTHFKNGAREWFPKLTTEELRTAFDDWLKAHDDEVRQAVLVEAAHAVLLERTRIVEWLSIRQVEEYADFDKSGLEIDQERGLVLDVVRQEIERGAHNRGAGE